MKQDILVSVVIPAYNAEKYIAECLNATLAQTYKNIEIWVLDDASSDGTIGVVEHYEKVDDRIHLVKLSHSGVSKVRNEGIKRSNGEYIVFFDADDYPDPLLIEKYMEVIKGMRKDSTSESESENPSIILCGMYCDNKFNANGKDTVQVLETEKGFYTGNYYCIERNMISYLCWLNLFNFVTNKIYSKSVLKEQAVKYNETIQNGEDLLFNMDYLEACEGKIGVINEPLYHYIKREKESLSLKYYDGAIEHTKYIYKKLIEYEKGLANHTDEDILVLEALLIRDWVSRLTSLRSDKTGDYDLFARIAIPHSQIATNEFQKMLDEIYKAGKISKLRYFSLKTRIFSVFYLFRWMYQIIKM